jgi:hypothetical protein
LDFAVAQLGFEAWLGSCNVVTYSHPIEKLAVAGELASVHSRTVGPDLRILSRIKTWLGFELGFEWN